MRLRSAIFAASAIAAALGGSAAVTSTAAFAQPAGFAAVQTCDFAGVAQIAPALTAAPHAVGANLNATLSNCALFGSSTAGTGNLFVNSLTGTASKTAEHMTGQFAIVWPASEALNPSSGTLTINEAKGHVAITTTVTGGAFAGDELTAGYHITSQTQVNAGTYKYTAQNVVSTAPLSVLVNEG
jgi:hypothetical protein